MNMTTDTSSGASEGRVLVVEPDEATRTFLVDNLTADGFGALCASDLGDAKTLLRHHDPDMVICTMNGSEGTELLKAVRVGDAHSAIDPETPWIACSGTIDDGMATRLLEAGADDVIVKPFSYPELRARVKSLLRRSYGRKRNIRCGDLIVDPKSKTATLDGEPVDLTMAEYRLLAFLVTDPTRVFTKDELLRALGARPSGSTRSLDSHACRLRVKLSRDDRRFVVNVWGVGYRLVDPVMA